MVCKGYTVRVQSAATADSADRSNYLSGHGCKPSDSHPGHGAEIFYSWDIGQVENESKGYSVGITIGANPGDSAYGFQIVQNLWDDRTYTRRYNDGEWQKWRMLAWLSDIPTSLPASDVKDWAKADSKPTYTFAEITEKPEKFTPDTHTHTISEVTDLQTTLDGKASKNHVHDSEKVTNWNNAVVSGTYYAAADATNNPSADAAYSGNVVKGSTIVTQTVVKESIDGDLYKYIRRGQLDTNRTTVTTWGQWQEIQYVVTE